MPAPARGPHPSSASLRQLFGIETPEHVALHLDLAGLGSRAAAGIVDTAVASLAILLLFWLLTLVGLTGPSGTLAGWLLALVILVFAFAFLAYFVLLEALNGGRTIGKQMLGIRVVMDTGHPVTPTAAVVRGLFRLLDCYFPLLPFLPGLGMIFLHRRNQRLGDIVAGTIVVRDIPIDWSLAAPPPSPAVGPGAREPEAVETGPPELTEEEFRLLDQFLARAADLEPTLQARLATDLADRFQDRVPRRTTDADAYLAALFAEEQRKRRSRFATRARTDVAGRTSVTAERFLERKREAWGKFHRLATQVERAGVSHLPEAEIPGFAARYREVAADLARARTYGVDQRVIEYLERVVSAGHNALYRARGRRRAPVIRYLVRDFPAAVVQSWAYVTAAFLLFAVPAALGYALIRTHPDLQDELTSPEMVSRAREAAARQAEGIGYAQSSQEELPLIASAIISNNIKIGFWAFVGGLAGGVLTALVLVTNGMSLGAGFGLFVNYHAGGYLATFVAGHGILELTAIFIAGGAGLRIAGALFAPGDRTRRDALVVEGRIAARMIGAVVTLLALAGTIEGLLSASDAPAVYKYATSALSVVFLGVYFGSGWAYRRREAGAIRPVYAPGREPS
ncbi:MAG TPA: stage II sporulation protein M [Gemmatimonadales bacterium]|nr:stage II sporulation protein M [Gemmatimonadales bacterium]